MSTLEPRKNLPVLIEAFQRFSRDHPDYARRPFLVRLVRCRNVTLSGVRLTRSAAWTCNLYQCRRVRVSAVLGTTTACKRRLASLPPSVTWSTHTSFTYADWE